MNPVAIIVISFITIYLDLIISFASFAQKKKEGSIHLGLCMFGAGLASLFYTLSMFQTAYFWASLFSSLFFISLTATVTTLMIYIVEFTETKVTGLTKFVIWFFRIWIGADVIVMAINPFYEIAIHYNHLEGKAINWQYAPRLLYYFHLAICYFMIIFVFVRLIITLSNEPKMFKNRYRFILGGLAGVVLLNGLYLFVSNTTMFDYSVFFYSVVGYILYWNAFHYVEKGMLNNFRQMTLDQLENPVILFDASDRFVFCNKSAEILIPEKKRNRSYKLPEFVKDVDLAGLEEHSDADVTFQWYDNRNLIGDKVYRCDYRLFLEDGKIQSKLVMFMDNSLEIDLLTGFHTIGSFRRNFGDEKREVEYPAGVAVCDLNRLTQINGVYGRKIGDQAIRKLADSMKKCCPSNTYFARLDEAYLMAICPNCDNQQMQEIMDAIRQELKDFTLIPTKLEMQSAVCVATVENKNIIVAAGSALTGLKGKKMLDHSSAHSSLLDSLAQTQQESDDCTEAHVKRTRMMGEKLGRRLGLSDIELSDLALLCLLHDIGKLGVPLEILNKPGKLTKEEWEVMRSHVDKGYRIAKASEELEGIAEFILHHHESWDGHGYPDGLKQEAIPLLSRIIAVVDTYDAMTNDRPYRKAMPVPKAREELKRCAGRQFDPYITSIFLDMLEEMDPVTEVLEAEEAEVYRPMGTGMEDDQAFEENENMDMVSYARYTLADDDNTIISVEGDFERMTGYAPEDIQTYHLTQLDLIFPEDRSAYVARVEREIKEHNEAYIEHRLRRKDGSSRYVLCYGKVVFDSISHTKNSKLLVVDVANMKSVSHLIEREKESARRALQRWVEESRLDKLTGLLNHSAFQNDAQQILIQKKPTDRVFMLMMDIDHFKTYNDTKGHSQGDDLLVKFATVLREMMQDGNLSGRMGGDEFAAIMIFGKDVSGEQINRELNHVWEHMSAEMNACDRKITVSMGAAEATQQGGLFVDLYKQADKALYRSKEEGRNRLTIVMNRRYFG